MYDLNLSHVRDQLVGGGANVRGLSGGERRRVSIGMELITEPRVVAMDEPTSGLDSYMAYKLMETCHEIAAKGSRIVLMSLHQPSPDMFTMLDSVLLMAAGRALFFGPTSAMPSYFCYLGLPCPPNRPAAEHLLQLASDPNTLANVMARLGYNNESSDDEREHPAVNCFAPAGIEEGASGDTVSYNVSAPFGVHQPTTTSSDDQSCVPSSSATSTQSPTEQLLAKHPDTARVADQQENAGYAGGTGGQADGRGSSESTSSSSRSLSSEDRGAAAVRFQQAKPVKETSAVRTFSEKGAQRSGGVVRRNSTIFSENAAEEVAASARLLPRVREMSVLFNRAFLDIRRNPSMLGLHVLIGLGLGVLVGCIFLDQQRTTAGAQNRAGGLFFTVVMFGFTSLTILDSLMLERALVQREIRSSYYSLSSYLTTRLVLDALLLRALPALLFTAVFYPLMGLAAQATKVATFFTVVALFSATVGSLAVAVSALANSPGKAVLFMNMILLLWTLVGGFLVNSHSIPIWLAWLRSISPLSYAFEALMINEFRGTSWNFRIQGVGSANNVDNSLFLRLLGLSPTRLVPDVVLLAGFYIICLVLANILYHLAATDVRMQWRRLCKSIKKKRKQ